MQPQCRQIQETHRTTHTGTTTRCRTQRRNRLNSKRLNSKRSKPHPPHTRGTFHRRLTQLYTEKSQGSCSGMATPDPHAPFQCDLQLQIQETHRTTHTKKAHATFMQPLQCVLQHDVANPHASTHMATPDDNNHAAIPIRSATTDSRNA